MPGLQEVAPPSPISIIVAAGVSEIRVDFPCPLGADHCPPQPPLIFDIGPLF